MLKLLLPLFLLLLFVRAGRAQELLADVSITTENVTVSDRQLLQQMQNDMRQFLNTRSWTGQNYRPEERIRCKFFVGLTGIPQAGTYTASVRVLTTRPVYGTGYQTNVLSFADRGWVFNYSPQNPIDFSENTFVGNLSSLLSFYAYIIVGMDKDSFARLSGSVYYDRARNILQNASSQTITNEADNGWKDTEPRNRYWLLNNLQDPLLEAFRTAAYAYYRQGLDIFIEKPQDARTNIFAGLKNVQTAVVRRPGTLLATSFFTTKSDEIANVFRTSQDPQQKQQVVSLLGEIDPTHNTRYQTILK